MHLFKDYGRFVNPAIHIIWFLLMIVGLSSAYFHATLSLIGKKNHEYIYINDNIMAQQFNESIIWIWMQCYLKLIDIPVAHNG
jgi:hypothetical protein